MGIEIFRLEQLGKTLLASATIAASLVSSGLAAYASIEPIKSGDVSREDCVEWQGGFNSKGYGVTGQKKLAHRVAFEENCGPILDGAMVGHRCDNPPCVNPRHLFLVSNSDNVRDAVAKGRHRTGREKLTHCPRSHPLEAGNLVSSALKRGERTCLACWRERDRKYKARKRETDREAVNAYHREYYRKNRSRSARLKREVQSQ